MQQQQQQQQLLMEHALPATPGTAAPDGAVVEESRSYSELCDVAAAAASTLSRLWKQSAHAKLLQRPPAQKIVPRHAGLFAQTLQVIDTLKAAVSTVAAIDALRVKDGVSATAKKHLMDSTFAAKPVSTLARLLVWLQQQPELLQLQLLSTSDESETPYHVLWLLCTEGLTEMLDCACDMADKNNDHDCRTLQQLGEELLHAGVLVQLPRFLRQAAQIISASQQLLNSLPFRSTIELTRVLVNFVTYSPAADVHGYDWQWAERMMQQLLHCAVAAGLMQPLPGGSAAAAAAALQQVAASSSSSSSSDAVLVLPRHEQVCGDIMEASRLLIRRAVDDVVLLFNSSREYNADEECCKFLAEPAAAEFALQALAARCMLMHKQHVCYQQQQQQQKGQAMCKQLGKLMRADLLLLPNPQQQLAQLLPSNAFLAADAARVSSSSAAKIGVGDILSFVRALDVSISWVTTVSSRSHAALSAAALQLSAQLLLRAAAYWQQQYYDLPDVARALLAAHTAGAADKVAAARAKQKMHAATQVLVWCSKLLQQQIGTLWCSGQWQPQLQLLQQGGGQALLQGLTLAVHCGSLHAKLGMEKDMSVLDLVGMLHWSVAGDTESEALKARRALFTSQLALKHPVSFFQFVDVCARSGRLDAANTPSLLQLAMNGSGRIGVKGLAELLNSPAATAALASALCSIFKVVTQDIVQQAATAQLAAAADAAGEDAQALSLHTFGADCMLKTLLLQLCKVLQAEALAAAAAAPPLSSSSSSVASCHANQVRASALFLQVLICRGLVQLHEAVMQLPGAAAAAAADLEQGTMGVPPTSGAASHPAAAGALMLPFMVDVLDVAMLAYSSLLLGLGKRLLDASNSSSSSSCGQPLRWQYLLRLMESRKLAVATAAFSTTWNTSSAQSVLDQNRMTLRAAAEGLPVAVVLGVALVSEQFVQLRQLYHDALLMCRTLAGVAPLPVVCNNPGCVELGGVSEAAAARYGCAGCGCRYCCAACQAAGWRSHKKACRRMAACGMRVT